MSVNPTPNPEPREERVAGLVGALRLTSQPFPSSIDAWLLTTVEALARSSYEYGVRVCAECRWFESHSDDCVTGISAEAWRRFTQKGEHGGS